MGSISRRSWLLCVLTMVLAGCHTVTEGTASHKELIPAHDAYQFWFTTCVMIGKVMICTPHYHWVHHDDECYVTLTDEEGSTRYSVACSTLDTYQDGGRYSTK